MRSLMGGLGACVRVSLPRRPFFTTPPCLVYPARSFTTTTPLHRAQVYRPTKNKKKVRMAQGMTTLKGQPFDRVLLESLMRVC